MKKKIVVIALGAFALVGTAAYLHAQSAKHALNDEGILLLTGSYCTPCQGTGWIRITKYAAPYKCYNCKGTGRVGSY